jgi:hypothetical protein
MPRTLIAATALAAGMSVVLLGCGGSPATTVARSAPVAGSTQKSPGARHPDRPGIRRVRSRWPKPGSAR